MFRLVMLTLALTTCAFAESISLDETRIFISQEQVRYQLYKSSNCENSYNWLFFPGGPGADSCYMKSLADVLELPGNVWLIDLPGNGSNLSNNYTDNFDAWFELYGNVVKQFKNPVIVGHSAGGTFSLLHPEFEGILRGLILLNATPHFWPEEAVAYSKQFDLPDYTIQMKAFVENPSSETFHEALKACMPYYFPKEHLEKGTNLLLQVPFNFKPALWFQYKGVQGEIEATWIPQKVPTLIISGKYDCMCPVTLFTKDARFLRDNISFTCIETAGHCPWLEAPDTIKNAITCFINDHLEK